MSLWSRILGSRLLRWGGIYLFSSFLSQSVMFLAWLFLPWRLSAEEIGQFALLSFLIELLTRLTMMGMDSALMRFYVDEIRRARVFSSAARWLGAGSCLAVLALLLSWNVVPRVFDGLSSIYHQVVWLVLAVALLSALANTVLMHYIASNSPGQFGQINTLRSLLLAGGYIAGAWCGLGIFGLLLSQLLAASAVIAVFYVSRPLGKLTFKSDPATMGELINYGSPMLFYALFSLVSDYSSRLALESQVTLGTMGIFQFYNQIATQINGVWTSINRAWTPHIFQQLAGHQDGAYLRIARFSLLGAGATACGIILVILLGFLGVSAKFIPHAYLAQIDLFYLLLLGPLFCSIYTAIYPAFYFDKKTLKISVIQSMISLLTIFLTFSFTVRFKSEGAALSWPLGIFLTPIIYLVFFPTLRARLAPSLMFLLVWGASGSLMTLALLVMHSSLWAAAALLLGIASTAFLGRNLLATKPTT